MRLVGYGAESIDPTTKLGVGSGKRRAVSVTVKEIIQDVLGYDGPDRFACGGDSGGPAFVKFMDGWAQVGLDSFGSDDCQKFGRYQRLDFDRAWLVSMGVPATRRAVTCVEDKICDGQCEADPDCVKLLCPLDETDTNCVSLPATPTTPPEPATGGEPESCATFMATPGTDGICYWVGDNNAMCGETPIQSATLDPATKRCLYVDVDGQNCGSGEATVSVQEQNCVYVDPAGMECGRTAAQCTTAGCTC
jgi:hypothetical protein